MSLQTALEIAVVLLGGAGIGGAWRASRTLVRQSRDLIEGVGAVKALADAQLTENGGGSLVDKVNRNTAMLPVLQETIVKNHREAEKRWDRLDPLLDRVQHLESAIDELQGEMHRLGIDVAEFKRGQEFFRRFAPRLMALEPEDRRAQIQALAERVIAEMGTEP